MTETSEVFIVDDDPAVRDSLRSLLEIEGYRVSAFATGQAMLDSVTPGVPRVLLLDVRLPDINGLDLQRRLVEMGVPLRTIVITGHGDIPMAVKAMKEGAVDFIEKPFRGSIIVDTVRSVIAAEASAPKTPAVDPAVMARIEGLTPREREVLELLVIGQQNKVIARHLGISPRTVENHRARVMEKMEANSLSHLIRMALSAGINPDASSDG